MVPRLQIKEPGADLGVRERPQVERWRMNRNYPSEGQRDELSRQGAASAKA